MSVSLRVILIIVLLGSVSTAASSQSRNDPIPYQDRAVVRDFEVRVARVYPDGTDIIMDFVGRGAVQPDDGNVYALILIEATYVGTKSGKGYDLDSPSFIKRDGKTELTSIGCPKAGFWQVNGDRSDADVFPDGAIELYYCIEIQKGTLGDILMYFDAGSREYVFFALTPNMTPPASPVSTPTT